MATWKKVIVSGSSANLANLQVDSLTNGQVVIGGGSGANLTSTAINGTGNIVATTGATGLTHAGAFSGSFSGSLTSSLTNVTKANLVVYDTATGQFSYAATSSFTASFAVSSSYALQATSASYALQATSASYATQASSSLYAITASLPLLGIITASVSNTTITFTKGDGSTFPITVAQSGSVATASYALFAQSAQVFPYTGSAIFSGSITVTGSLIATLGITGSLYGTSSFSVSSSYALQATSASYSVQATSASYATQATSASYALQSTSASYALSASWAPGGGGQALTFGTGLSGSIATYNGSSVATVAISGSATLTSNLIPKWTGTGLVNSNITDNGTQIQIGAGASGGVTIAAGGIGVTGNSTFNNNVTITGDLTVAGTASFTNTDNLTIKDKFILINSGSTVLADSGWVSQYTSSGSGSAFYLDANSTGPYGRFAVAYDVIGTSTAVTPDEYMVTVKINQAAGPTFTPTWGTGSNGAGNMWVTTAGDIYIYS